MAPVVTMLSILCAAGIDAKFNQFLARVEKTQKSTMASLSYDVSVKGLFPARGQMVHLGGNLMAEQYFEHGPKKGINFTINMSHSYYSGSATVDGKCEVLQRQRIGRTPFQAASPLELFGLRIDCPEGRNGVVELCRTPWLKAARKEDNGDWVAEIENTNYQITGTLYFGEKPVPHFRKTDLTMRPPQLKGAAVYERLEVLEWTTQDGLFLPVRATFTLEEEKDKSRNHVQEMTLSNFNLKPIWNPNKYLDQKNSPGVEYRDEITGTSRQPGVPKADIEAAKAAAKAELADTTSASASQQNVKAEPSFYDVYSTEILIIAFAVVAGLGIVIGRRWRA